MRLAFSDRRSHFHLRSTLYPTPPTPSIPAPISALSLHSLLHSHVLTYVAHTPNIVALVGTSISERLFVQTRLTRPRVMHPQQIIVRRLGLPPFTRGSPGFVRRKDTLGLDVVKVLCSRNGRPPAPQVGALSLKDTTVRLLSLRSHCETLSTLT
jgi:hypothetical protein